ncbi:hypothetical protein ACFOD1_08200 [Pseudidiomarina halophila]|uniref:Multifunctional CCA tRNA nucleotidyl transferase/2'3'-cyclic phosphodiesterase/2'nucleotidase/phosphatase n=1 Tax=Pseudidiomarina halophila TaxID=1449799 RepID=A0A432Y1T9_9GAMM|nr:multifunctional CCA tRNA nucleotidyl transferase/2'3'-cyclic phosphodiesterase/2'nucleotidase/phosphatase [Pseudidiomarina halophila]RUO54907.1 multifunctional CCA tRNA nucleotidyl transferase/2'3'-cyclic phosphodiesterase/2'nucleotidase/phosphatase [Pseudidiomarina halophila]
MKVYLVGGAVRDKLLGKTVHERDYVVVGATPEEMLARGFRQVGKDFPVFLHPHTDEEYALARTERKSGRGYTGFTVAADPSVTLEQDLQRRDLTINAIAETDDGELIDPYGGVADLKARRIRHVSAAFVEDPLRVLRAARFAARFADDGFVVAAETLELMREISANDELATLANERVWHETVKALKTARPDVYFQVLKDAHALSPWFPELEQDETFKAVTTRLATLDVASTELVFALWMGELPDTGEVNALCDRLRVPNQWHKLGQLACQWHAAKQSLMQSSVVIDCLQQADVWRRPERFQQLLEIWREQGLGATDREKLQLAFHTASDVSAGALLTQARERGESLVGPEIGAAVQQARNAAITEVLKE